MSTQSKPFTGDFDLLPVRAHFDCGPVPPSPSMADFDNAMTASINADPFTIEGAAAIWHSEAVRWRRGPEHANQPLDIAAIAKATAKQLYARQSERLTAEGDDYEDTDDHGYSRGDDMRL